ncbi:MAG: hypothetical protein U9R42_08840 [Bacteroidota bacterium]|nr:hypothetical protein [Bacteroidota bacterium]
MKNLTKTLLKYYQNNKTKVYTIVSIITVIILLLLGFYYKQFSNIYYWIGFYIMIFQMLIITFIYFETIEIRIKEKKESNKLTEHKKAVKKATHKPTGSQFKRLNNKMVKNIRKYIKQLKRKLES